MIRSISATNFKSITQIDMKSSALNLLTGVNSSGKSSLLQVMLLLRESYLRGHLLSPHKRIFLGERELSYVNLGTFRDVMSQQAASGDTLTLAIEDDEGRLAFTSISYSAAENGGLGVVGGKVTESLGNWKGSALFSERSFQYLSADRIIPREDYPRFQGDYELGKDGQFAPHFLAEFGPKEIPIKALMHPQSGKDDSSLINQFNAWMGDISPNIEAQAKENLATNRVELSYRYRTPDGVPTLERKPQNVGFGITQTLPVLVAILSARPGDLLLLENPETHLHPRGQSRLGLLMALAAQAGVQIYVESHSDHVLNGIRVATRRGQISPDQVNILYFDRDSKDQSTRCTPLHLDVHGRIDSWPAGFFDEWDNMLDELL